MNRVLGAFIILAIGSLAIIFIRKPASQIQKPPAKATTATHVYTYVEQMPEMPGGGGDGAIVAAVYKELKVPSLRPQPDWGRPIVSFTVGPDGIVYGEKISVSSGEPAYDKALLNAVRALPRLTPGCQTDKPVAVSFEMPIAIRLQ